MRRGVWAAALVLLAAAIWLGWGMRPSDASRISRLLNRLAADATPGSGESETDRLARGARISSCLTSDVRLERGDSAPPIEGREAIVGLALQAGGAGGPARLRLADVGVTVDQGDATARATMTATLVTLDTQSGVEVVDAREVETNWVKQDGEWKIRRAAVVGTLRR